VKHVFAVILVFAGLGILHAPASAQGGWRQWNVFMRDGTRIEANPLGMNEAGQFTRGMGKEPGIERSQISYLSISRTELPPLPGGVFDQDLVVQVDGTRSLGAVAFRGLKFSEGTVLQNGKEISTEKIAYIKFAAPKKKKVFKKKSP